MSITLSNWEKLNSWFTTPSFDFASCKSLSVSIPQILTVPEFFRTREEMTPIIVDLPAPFGPSNAKKSPFFTSRFIPLRASTLLL